MSHKPALLTAIASGKGGTGKTFLAVTLAHALSHEGEKVLLFDGDLGLSNVAVQMGLTEICDFSSVLSGAKAARDGALRYGGGAGKRGGFDVLAAPAGSTQLAQTAAPTILRTVAALRLALGYDRVILDLGGGVTDAVMRFADTADDTIVVLTPDPTALTDAYAFIKLHAQRICQLRQSASIPGVIVNQAASEREAQAIAGALGNACHGFLGLPLDYLGSVRRDAKVVDALRHQQPIFAVHPKCNAAMDIAALAARMAHRHDVAALRRSGMR